VESLPTSPIPHDHGQKAANLNESSRRRSIPVSWRRLARRSMSYQCILSLAQTSSAFPWYGVGPYYLAQHSAVSGISIGRSRWSTHNTMAAFSSSARAKLIVGAAIAAVNPAVAVKKRLTLSDDDENANTLLCLGDDGAQLSYNLQEYDTVIATALGKASSAMAVYVLDRLLEASGAHHPDLSGDMQGTSPHRGIWIPMKS
jgi:hypothetical protein